MNITYTFNVMGWVIIQLNLSRIFFFIQGCKPILSTNHVLESTKINLPSEIYLSVILVNKSKMTNILSHLIKIIDNIVMLLPLFPLPLIMEVFPLLFWILVAQKALRKRIVPTILQFMSFLIINHTSLLLLLIGLLDIFAFTFLLERFLSPSIGYHGLFFFIGIFKRSFLLL